MAKAGAASAFVVMATVVVVTDVTAVEKTLCLDGGMGGRRQGMPDALVVFVVAAVTASSDSSSSASYHRARKWNSKTTTSCFV